MIILADSAGYNGEHRHALFNIFWDRGIVPFCDCTVWGDVDGNDYINPVDVVFMVNYVYMNNDMRVQHENCPLEAGDVNCDGSVDPVDIVLYVDYVYNGRDRFCDDPCD